MSLRHAVLGFLSLKPLTGYDLKKAFDGSVSNFWPADQAQIYRTLAQLTEEGLAEVRVVPQEGRPDRKEHSITAGGVEELDRWLRTPLDPQPTREPFLLKVFFAGRLARDEFVTIVDERIAEGEIELDVFRDIIAGVAAATGNAPMTLERWLPIVTLDNGIRHFRAELAWLRDLRSQALDPETNVPHAWRQLKDELLPQMGESQ
jgi:PadR family transcriptional regulator AphA